MSVLRPHHYLYIAAIAFALVFACTIGWRGWADAPPRIVATCKTSASSSLCYAERVKTVLTRQGLGPALDVVAYVYVNDARFASECHGEMHVLGADAYQLFAQHKPVELDQKAAACGYGFYHGFMQALLYATHDYGEARAFCAYAGELIPNPAGYTEGACYHGMGHGFTDGGDSVAVGDPVAIAAPGLDICQKIASAPEWEFRCYSGVFNSMAILAQDPKNKLDVHDDPFLFCKTAGYSVLEKRACYAEMNTLVVEMSKRNIEKTVDYIEKIADPIYHVVALKSALAVYGAYNRESADLPATVAHTCGQYDGALQDICVGAFVSGMLEMGTPGSEQVAVLALCRANELTSSMQGACYKQLIDVPQIFFSREVVESMCNAAPPQVRETLQTCATL